MNKDMFFGFLNGEKEYVGLRMPVSLVRAIENVAGSRGRSRFIVIACASYFLEHGSEFSEALQKEEHDKRIRRIEELKEELAVLEGEE